MSQWGARGRAERGDDYRRILAAYYDGLEPVRWTGTQRVRVGIVRHTDAVTVGGDGAFGVRAGSDVLASSTVGAWSVSAAGGRVVRVTAPEGFKLPLVLSAVDAPDRVSVDGSAQVIVLDVTFVLPKAARIDALLSSHSIVLARVGDVFEAGSGRIRVPVDAARLSRSGSYQLALNAFDGRQRTSKSLPVRIDRAGAGPLLPAALAIALLLLAGAAVLRDARTPVAPPSAVPEPMLPVPAAEPSG
jgi:hypothetical protein